MLINIVKAIAFLSAIIGCIQMYRIGQMWGFEDFQYIAVFFMIALILLVIATLNS